MTMEVQFANDLKVGQSVKTKKIHTTIVMGNLEYPQLPVIEIPERVHGEITYISNFSGEFHVKWIELEVTTIEQFDSIALDALEFEMKGGWEKTDDGLQVKYYNTETRSMIRYIRPRKRGLIKGKWFMDANKLCEGKIVVGYYKTKDEVDKIVEAFLKEYAK